jgi:hypothetical protein
VGGVVLFIARGTNDTTIFVELEHDDRIFEAFAQGAGNQEWLALAGQNHPFVTIGQNDIDR